MRPGSCLVSLPAGKLRAMESLNGQFLIASPSILDPNFHRTVVFVTAHTEEGAIGVILNRRSDATVGEAVPQLAPLTDLDDIFTEDPEGLWSSVLRRKGGQYELVARMPLDPSLN